MWYHLLIIIYTREVRVVIYLYIVRVLSLIIATNDLLSFHCTLQWNSSTHSYSVTVQLNVSDDIISDLAFFYISYITKRKSNQETLSHHFVTDITPHNVSFFTVLVIIILIVQDQNAFTYIDEDRSSTDNDTISIYDVIIVLCHAYCPYCYCRYYHTG